MKLWISGEIDSSVGDSFRIARNYLEQQVNNILSAKSYGNGVLSWDIIMIISKEKGKESYKYNSKKKDTDIYIVIDFDSFNSSDSLTKKTILLEALIHCIDKISSLNIPDFNFVELKKDLLDFKETIFNQHAN